ncbi:tungstate ABC transporter substrate-binding protein WtpA [Candidatus Geothermarchaeota archaeon]|nr:MAG: tungstate ABC transporter substrate-binding protein WtpA [Candidatus Geothermarchaeota archaeon]
MSRTVLLMLLVIICALAGLLAYFTFHSQRERSRLKIFHAGSLALMLNEAERAYENIRTDIDIQREPSGSVKAVRKISDLGRQCDIVMVADYRVIDNYLVPAYANWNLIFCSNEMVLCFTNKSKYAYEINEENWYKILLRPGVRYGFSNPNLDPCGYRALSIIYMSSVYYEQEDIWRNLVLKYIPDIKIVSNGSGHFIFFPVRFEYISGGKLVLRDKEIDLIQLLEIGSLDYAFEYRNVAKEHGLRYVSLPHELNLRDNPFIKVFIILYTGDPKRQKSVAITGIKYGLTIPKNCENYKEAIKFLKWLLYQDGKEIIEKHGFVLIPYEFKGEVPSELREYE